MCSPSSTGEENIKTQVYLLPNLVELTFGESRVQALHLH